MRININNRTFFISERSGYVFEEFNGRPGTMGDQLFNYNKKLRCSVALTVDPANESQAVAIIRRWIRQR